MSTIIRITILLNLIMSFTLPALGIYYIKKSTSMYNKDPFYNKVLNLSNQETWEFGLKFLGKAYIISGILHLVLFLTVLSLVIGQDEIVKIRVFSFSLLIWNVFYWIPLIITGKMTKNYSKQQMLDTKR